MNQTKLSKDNELVEIIISQTNSRSEVNLAYNQLYNKYSPMIKTYINKLIQSIDDFDKEEIHALTMYKILSCINQYRFEYPFKVWIKTIARNNVIDYLRKKKMSTSPLDGYEIENANSPDVILEAKETSRSIQQFIKEQKVKYQEILKLRIEYGMSCKEIAARMQMPISSISTVLFRNRILLKKSGIFGC
jgi:RNA polymerase sigma factor (sigma-70 family)